MTTLPPPGAQKNIRNIPNSLVLTNKITAAQRRTAMMNTEGLSIEDHLIKTGVITERDIIDAQIQVGDPTAVIATDLQPQPEAIDKIDQRYAEKNLILPTEITDTAITITTTRQQQNNIALTDQIKKLTGVSTVKYLISTQDEILRAIATNYRADGEIKRTLAAQQKAAKEAEAKKTSKSGGEQLVVQEENEVIRIVDLILDQAIRDKASDIHIETQETGIYVRYRIDGVLKDAQRIPDLAFAAPLVSRIKIMSELNIAERAKPQDGRLTLHKNGKKIDFRVAILPANGGEKVVMRILDNTTASVELSKLGFTPYNYERFKRGYTKPYGMVLATGPTGSGKSTTLYAALNEVNSPEINIITVEDPVEYRIDRINQVQINPKRDLTFANALRSILRADPDVVLIGEMRDKETAHIAVEAAQTGHLVLSTLHTNDAASAVTRITEMGVEPFLVGDVVETIVAQRLLRKLCGTCKQPWEYDNNVITHLELPQNSTQYNPDTHTLCIPKPGGCKDCAGTGYSGRMAVHEVLTMSPNIERCIIKGGNSMEVHDIATAEGMLTLKQDAWDKALTGITSLAEIARVVA